MIFCCSILLLLLTPVLANAGAIDVAVLPVRGSGGRSTAVEVVPADKALNASICGTWQSNQVRCLHRQFKGSHVFDDQLYPDSDFTLSLFSNEASDSTEITFRTDFGVPATPLRIVTMVADSTSIFLEWTARFPAYLHGPPTGYRVMLCRLPGQDACKVTHTHDNSTLLDGLKPLTRYSVSLWAFNVDSYGDVLEDPQVSTTVSVETTRLTVGLGIPVALVCFSAILIVGLVVLCVKEQFWPSNPKHFILIEDEFKL